MTETCAHRHHLPPPWPLALLALACLMISAATRAQIVHVANYSGSEFEGWKRATVDVMPPTKSGQVGDVRFVLGRNIGLDAKVVDLHLRLAPGEVRSIDLSKAKAVPFELAPLPAEPLEFFGRPSILGMPMRVVDARPDGAAWLAHLRARTGPMLCVDLWVTWYPDQPSWATGEAVVTASNPTVPDLVATVPEDFRLRFGAADVVVPGLPIAPPRLGMASDLLGRQIRDAVLGQPSPIRPERLDHANDGRSDVATGLDDLASGNPSVSERHSARAAIAQAVDDGAPVRMLPHADARLLIGLALMPGASGPVGGLGDDRPVRLDDADRGATGEGDGAGFRWSAHGNRWVAVSQVASLTTETAAVPEWCAPIEATARAESVAIVPAGGAVATALVFLDRSAGAASPGPAHSATASAALRREGALRGETLRDRAEVDAIARPQDGRDVLDLAGPVALRDDDLLVGLRGRRASDAEAPGAIAELGVGGGGRAAGSLDGHRSGLSLGAPWPGGAGREHSLATGGSRPDLARYVNQLDYNSRHEKEAIRTTGLRATDFFGAGRIWADSGGARSSDRGSEAVYLSAGVRWPAAGGASAAVDRPGSGRDDGLAAGDGGGAVLLPAGTVIGDGQARSFPLVFIWRQHLTSALEWSSAGAAASLGVCANGISKLWPDGNPVPVSDPLQWARRNWAGAIARLHTWDAGPLGVKANSGDTGAQEDQVFVGGECCSGPASLGAETVRYLAALGQSRRPCQHLEANGALLDLAKHPKLVMWSGRVHWHAEVSPDRLGKPHALTTIESHGWSGPDREHWLENAVAIAYRLTGSPALQWQLEAQARLFLLQETVDPKLSTSDFSAERAIGWAGIVAVHLWRSLEDRTLAERVAQRWRDRVAKVYIPKLRGKPLGVWLPRNDARLTADTGWAPLNWMPYQQAVGAYGLDYACRLIGPPAGRELALEGARAAMRAWQRQPDGRWKAWSYWGYSATETVPFVEHAGAAHGPNVWVWFTPAVWMVRDREPQNEQARMIWQQVVRETDPKWVPVESETRR